MVSQPHRTAPIDLTAARAEVDWVLTDFLARRTQDAAAGQLPAEVVEVLGGFLSSGGKRLRPLLCVTGWHAAGEHGGVTPVLHVAASLEMFHAFCLIHDDIMDSSHTRRGTPTVHRTLARSYAACRSRTTADDLGARAAILVGDLALTWADELLYAAGLTTVQLASIMPLISAMRTEVMYGQYLDLTAAGAPTGDVNRALAIIRYKTAKYTVERPLHIGATLAGADDALRASLSAYALPIGEAFQLRDDLLGVYGRPELTGKPCLDDLRAGKHTTLIAIALTRADGQQTSLLRNLVGDPELDEQGAATVRRILTSTGAEMAVERMIRKRYAQATAALERASFTSVSRTALRELAAKAAWRFS